MIKSIYCHTREHVFTELTGTGKIAELVSDPEHVFWLDVENPTEQELATVAKIFHLHPLAIEDASHEHQRPKVEEYEHFFFLVFYAVGLDPAKQKLITHEIDMFVGTNYVITVHTHAIEELAEAEQRWRRNITRMEQGLGILLYSLLDTIVDRYFPVIDVLVEQADGFDDRLFARVGNVREDQLTFDLLALKKQFLAFRRIATPELDVLSALTNRDNPFFDEHVVLYFRDIYDHLTRVAETLDMYRDQLSSTMEANLSVASNALNKVMRMLTGVSIILMLNALVAGIYGMNFKFIPELQWHYGYFGALALMATMSTLLLLYFKHLKWF